jgi:hypothetical protein
MMELSYHFVFTLSPCLIHCHISVYFCFTSEQSHTMTFQWEINVKKKTKLGREMKRCSCLKEME